MHSHCCCCLEKYKWMQTSVHTPCICAQLAHAVKISIKQSRNIAQSYFNDAWVWKCIQGYYADINSGQLGRETFQALCHMFSHSITSFRCYSVKEEAPVELNTKCVALASKECTCFRALAGLNPLFILMVPISSYLSRVSKDGRQYDHRLGRSIMERAFKNEKLLRADYSEVENNTH